MINKEGMQTEKNREGREFLFTLQEPIRTK